uniref:Uncharacterized protein n=1 Tax=viral metagenome TaxID=1070528 RepID=A0A6M3LEX4_9ZZZZ
MNTPKRTAKQRVIDRLKAQGFTRGCGDLQEYERAENNILSFGEPASRRDEVIRWITEYLGV